MRIAFDATAILGPMSKNRGIGNYSLSQFTTIINQDTENQYFFFNLYEDDFALKKYLNNSSRFVEVAMYSGPDLLLLSELEYKDVVGDLIKKFIDVYHIDVFCITSPFDSKNVMYQKDWFEKCKVTAIVYDIIPYVMKSHYLADKVTYEWYMKCVDMLRWVDEIQVISQSVKDDLISYLKFDSEKISVIWGAVDTRYREIHVTDSDKKQIYQKFGISGDFVMCTGGDDERKNIAGLIEAYSKLPQKLIEQYQLVIVCKLSQNAVIRYTNLAANLNIESNVVLTNFVSDEELLLLYNMATVMAFPSVYEGFGLPVVEAWACGTPVLTSNNSSLVQIAGEGAVIVDPKNIKDITRGLKYALSECDLEELLKKGKKQLELFQWDKVAKASIASFNKLKEKAPKGESNNGIKKIAMFAPLPPLESGISDYSVDIINALSDYYSIDAYVDDGYKPNVKFRGNVEIFPHNAFEKNRQKYEEVIYQVGNSVFHLYMYEYIRKYSGVVVLHDYNMHAVLVHHALAMNNDYDLYEKYLMEDYSEEEVKAYIKKLKEGQCGYKIREWEANGIVTNYAKKVIVHSFDAKEKLLKRNIGCAVKQIWSFVNIGGLTNSAEKDALKQKKGYSKDCVLFIAFGHIHETKRAVPILKAFTKLVKGYENIRMVYVGKLADDLVVEFENVIAENEITDLVKVTGYTSLDEFEEYIKIADVCLNLRYPYNGETSASLIRNLAQGNLVITNNIGSFGEIPDDVCIKLPNVADVSWDEEIEQIYCAMKAFLDEPEKHKIISDQARKFALEKLDVKIAAKEYASFISSEIVASVNEEMLCSLTKKVLEMGASNKELKKMAKTLAWLKEHAQTEYAPPILWSCVCKEADFVELHSYIAELPTLQAVYPQFHIPQGILHRKLWEWAFITSILDKGGMLSEGKRGVGFAVGIEPLPSLFAAKGCEILATDYWEVENNSWELTGQNLNGNLEILNQYKLCEDKLFHQRVKVINVDMNYIPDDLQGYDFCWSSCAVEHLGNIELGKKFFYDHMKILKPGGVAVHTIEFNVSSNSETIMEGDTVCFRRCDIEEIASRLREDGCEVVCSFDYGDAQGDLFIDEPPYYSQNPQYHLHLNIGGYNCTSYGVVVRKRL